MTQEERNLLLIDLSGRFAYHPFVYGKTGYTYNEGRITGLFSSGVHIMTGGGSQFHYFIEEIKPYLRPMSSMTDEEKIELCTRAYAPDEMKTIKEKLYVIQYNAEYANEFYNEHHLDFRGLIEKGLALEAPEGMYNY